MVVNRNKCKVNGGKYGKRIDFGSKAYFQVGCNPIEVTVQSNKGDYTFTWEQ